MPDQTRLSTVIENEIKLELSCKLHSMGGGSFPATKSPLILVAEFFSQFMRLEIVPNSVVRGKGSVSHMNAKVTTQTKISRRSAWMFLVRTLAA